MVERRREQAAEESRKAGQRAKRLLISACPCQTDLMLPLMSFPTSGNGLSKPLDSGLRRAATGLPPSRRIQDFLGGSFQTPLYLWNLNRLFWFRLS